MAFDFSRLKKHITVEPVSILFIGIAVIIDCANTNLILQKKCRFNITSEPNLDIPCVDEKPALLLLSQINSFYRLISMVFSALFALFAMNWSDLAGRRRRPFILLPVVGQIFQSLAGCLHAYFWTWPPLSAALTHFILEMSSGGFVLLAISTQAYLSEVTSVEDRTMRLGILTAVKLFGDLWGNGSSGFILRGFGFFYTYLMCFILSLITVVAVLYFVKDTSVVVYKKPGFRQIFSLKQVVESFKIVFNKSLGKKRILVLILVVVHITILFSMHGEMTMLYIFLRHKFHWEERQYSSYILYRYMGATLGSIFCSLVLSERLKIHDGLIGVFAGVWDTIAALGYLFANQNWHLYVVPLFDIFHRTAFNVGYSLCSKFFDKDQFGRLNSVIVIFALFAVGSQPAYNMIFQETIDVFPSAYFLLSIVLDVVVVILYGVTYLLSKKIDKVAPVKKEEKPMIAS